MCIQQYNICIYNIRIFGNSYQVVKIRSYRRHFSNPDNKLGTIIHRTSAFHFPIFFLSFLSLLLHANKLRRLRVAKKNLYIVIVVYKLFTVFADWSYFFKPAETCSAAARGLFRDVTIFTTSFGQQICSVPRFFYFDIEKLFNNCSVYIFKVSFCFCFEFC